MTIRAKITWASVFFLGVSAVVGAACYLNIRREEAAFAASQRAARTHAAVTDIDYFLARRVRALQNHVLLGDEAEKLQLLQAAGQIKNQLAAWKTAAGRAEAEAREIPAVEAVCAALNAAVDQVLARMDAGDRAGAMARVESDFTPVSARVLASYREIKSRTETLAARTERDVVGELRRNHLRLLGGLGAVVFFGWVFLISFYRSVIVPIRHMREWADRVARGERHVPMDFSGRNELTDLARSLGEMAIQLTRPKPPAPVHPPPGGLLMTPAPPRAPSLDFEEAVEGFREILGQMAGRTPPQPPKAG